MRLHYRDVRTMCLTVIQWSSTHCNYDKDCTNVALKSFKVMSYSPSVFIEDETLPEIIWPHHTDSIFICLCIQHYISWYHTHLNYTDLITDRTNCLRVVCEPIFTRYSNAFLWSHIRYTSSPTIFDLPLHIDCIFISVVQGPSCFRNHKDIVP